jgi:FtsZ-binding cell division protein ZapB
LKKLALVLVILAMAFGTAFAESEKVLFFEAALAPGDTIFSDAPTGFLKLAEALRGKGMLVASMSVGELAREKLAPYNIIVLHPSPERPLQEDEISALVWFVAQKGGSLFVHGGTAKVVNPLTEIFGISMDKSTLIDTSSAMEGSDGRKFVLTKFPQPIFAFEGVQSIGFYGGPPLVLSQNSAAVVRGDEDCYSDNGLYSIGSTPPVGAVSFFGRGIILVKSDRSVFDNANIEGYQNLEWAKSVFVQLAAAEAGGIQREQSLLGLRERVNELEKQLGLANEKLQKYESDLAASYERIEKLQDQVKNLEESNKSLNERLETAQKERDKLKATLAKYRSPDTLKIAGIVAIVVVFVLLLLGFFLGRWSVRARV